MSKAQKVARAAETLADVWEHAEELGLIDQLRAWWGSRRAVKRRARRRRARKRGARSVCSVCGSPYKLVDDDPPVCLACSMTRLRGG